MFATGSQALVSLIADNWQTTRTGRVDVPAITETYRSNPGTVFVTHDREKVADDHAVHDLIHCYHPQASPLDVQDNGYKEQNVLESVQIDIVATDRPDPNTGERLSAAENLVGKREDEVTVRNAAGIGLDEPPYPGIFGEVKYLLEEVRRGHAEYDVVEHTVVNLFLGNSDANISLDVGLERVAANTVV